MYAIDPNGQGDVTQSRLLWTSRDVGRVVGTPIAKDGLLYVGDLGGTIHCLDAATRHVNNGHIDAIERRSAHNAGGLHESSFCKSARS